jgi:hypothetical protein
VHDRLTYSVEQAAAPGRQADGAGELALAATAGHLDRAGSTVAPGVQL